MNKVLMQQHIDANTHLDAFPVLKKDGSNAGHFYCADVVGGRRFALNYGGYPRSEIAEINEASSLEMQMNLLQSLQEIPVSDHNSGKSDAEIMLGHKSKYIQTPSESVRWLEDQISLRDTQRSQGDTKKDDKIEFNRDDVVDNV